jgi:hypothetical protein
MTTEKPPVNLHAEHAALCQQVAALQDDFERRIAALEAGHVAPVVHEPLVESALQKRIRIRREARAAGVQAPVAVEDHRTAEPPADYAARKAAKRAQIAKDAAEKHAAIEAQRAAQAAGAKPKKVRK